TTRAGLNSGVSSFGGGVTNAGAITAGNGGIAITGVPTFTGNVSNAGTIAAPTGISITNSTITGQIIDSGLITGGIKIDAASRITSTATAIAVAGPSFGGGISNGGTITTANAGILLQNVTSFGGNITNSGALAGATGIKVIASTIQGQIADSGSILASGHGIFIDSTSKVTVTGFLNADVLVTGPTFAGGISNAGALSSGATGIGIEIRSSAFGGGVSNSGTISNSGIAMFIHG